MGICTSSQGNDEENPWRKRTPEKKTLSENDKTTTSSADGASNDPVNNDVMEAPKTHVISETVYQAETLSENDKTTTSSADGASNDPVNNDVMEAPKTHVISETVYQAETLSENDKTTTSSADGASNDPVNNDVMEAPKTHVISETVYQEKSPMVQSASNQIGSSKTSKKPQQPVHETLSGNEKTMTSTPDGASSDPVNNDAMEVLWPPIISTTVDEDLETSHFVLVHGACFGPSCWDKVVQHLRDGGFEVDIIDLTGSEDPSYDPKNVLSLSQYVKPLTSFLKNLDKGKKVILVGHDFGGVCISHAMEAFPHGIAKAVFIAAPMLMDFQNCIDMYTLQEGQNKQIEDAQHLLYANENDKYPSAIEFKKEWVKDLLCNKLASEDMSVAYNCMRPVPWAPVMEKLSLSENYCLVRRFYIQTPENNAIPLHLQRLMCCFNPPEEVYRLEDSDHSPFFSKDKALYDLLVKIAEKPLNQRLDRSCGDLTTR